MQALVDDYPWVLVVLVPLAWVAVMYAAAVPWRPAPRIR
jgi:hypothetical protein